MGKSYNVLHITTSLEGGAGIAARRLHEELLDRGVDSKILSLSDSESTTNCNHAYSYTSRIKKGLRNRLYKKLSKFFSSFKFINEVKRIEGEFEVFSTPKTHFYPEKMNLVKNADIVHLHWVANFINFPTFFNSIKNKKVVWTLHDMNPFMGGFHYEGDKVRNIHLDYIEKQFLDIKKKAYLDINKSKCCIIYLNDWMKKKSEKYKGLSQFNSKVIPNCFSFSNFNVVSREIARRNLKIDPRDKVILFASQSLSNNRKGFEILIEALKKLESKAKENITLLTFGGANKINFSININTVHLGTIREMKLIAEAYSSADLFVIPSLEDNLPNVMLESWACGTPVISFDNGGMKDYILPGLNGELVREQTPAALAEVIKKSFGNSYSREDIISYAVENFSPDVVCNKIINEVYSI